VNLSAKTEYACLAVLELATRYDSGQLLKIKDIAEKHGIPARFLVQILLQLKSAGLVASTRGAAGGYRLARDPAEISLADVVQIVDGREETLSSNISATTPASRALLSAWQRVADAQRGLLAAVTFAQLAADAHTADENMYYI